MPFEKITPSSLPVRRSPNGSITSKSGFGICPPSVVIECANRLFGYYRTGDANDPKTFVTGIATILARYPEDVVRQVTDPTGLPSRSKWLPNIYEITEACEEIMEPRRRAEAQRQKALETASLIAQGPPVSAEARARAVAKWERERPGPAAAAPRQEQDIAEILARGTGMSVEEVRASLTALPDARAEAGR